MRVRGRHLAAHRVQPAVWGRVPGRRARGETRGNRRGHTRRQTMYRRLLRVGASALFLLPANKIWGKVMFSQVFVCPQWGGVGERGWGAVVKRSRVCDERDMC